MNQKIANEPSGQFPPLLYGQQQDAEKLNQAIGHIEMKVIEVKNDIEGLLSMLELQEKVDWPTMLGKFSSLASAMAQLQSSLRKSALPSGVEDYGHLLRRHLLVPHRLSNEVDPNLQAVSNNRLHFWNHDIAPEYLRTKPTPEFEAEEAQLDNEKNARTFDQVNKQILTMNKHIEMLLTSISENAKSHANSNIDAPSYDSQETYKLVRAIINGDGLRPPRFTGSAQSDATNNSSSNNTTVSSNSSSNHNRPSGGALNDQRH